LSGGICRVRALDQIHLPLDHRGARYWVQPAGVDVVLHRQSGQIGDAAAMSQKLVGNLGRIDAEGRIGKIRQAPGKRQRERHPPIH